MSDVHPVFPWLTQARRAWLYRVVTALAPLTVLYGVVSGEEAAVWVGAIAAILGSGTAALHTPADD